jgi:eukaryotic-like serine/threonine-protein kinase
MALLSKIFKKSGSKNINTSPVGSEAFKTGQLLANRYMLREIIGKGAMGCVFRAEDRLLGNVSVAVKMHSQHLLSQQMTEQFFKEARTGALLGHQNINIVRVLDYGIHNDSIPFYVMEYIEGETLEQAIALQPLKIDRFLKLMAQVCSGLQSAHQGLIIDNKLYCVVHRDIKPSNIFITENQSLGEIAKVLDFGISDLFQKNAQTKEQPLVGTLAYSSGEQLNQQPPDPRSDIYSLGVTMFEALTGHLPIVPERKSLLGWIEAHCSQAPTSISKVAPYLQIPKALDQLIQSCLEKDMQNRPQTMNECLNVLKALASSTSERFNRFPSEEPVENIENILDEIINSPDINPLNIIDNATKVLDVPLNDQALKVSWPLDKPVAEIVFTQIFEGFKEETASIWVMLSHANVQQQFLAHHYTKFLFDDEFSSMIAWITVLFDEAGHLRCFPSYINLKGDRNEKMIQRLIEQGEYMLMLFDILEPTQPVKVLTLSISESQQKLLSQRVRSAQKASIFDQAQVGKLKLKEKYQAFRRELPNHLKKLAMI